MGSEPSSDAEKRRRGPRFSEETVQEILEFFPGLAVLYRHGKILRINYTGATMLGYDGPEDLIGRDFDDCLPPEYAGAEFVEQVLADGVPCPAMLRRADGSQIGADFRVQWARELGADTMVVRAEDITHRIEMSADIERSEARFRSLVDNALDMICACNDGKVTYINRAGLSLLAADTKDQVVGRPVADLFHGDYQLIFEDQEALGMLLSEVAEEEGLLPARLARIDGTFMDVQISLAPIEDSEGGFMLEALDITEHRNAVMALHQMNQELEQRVKDRTRELSEEVERRREAEEQLRHMATHDGLTGLPNRRLLMDRLDAILSRAHRYQKHAAIVFVDLDGFKAVNDTHGHDAGDALLKEVASRLQDQTRETDTVARMGGDEFVLAYTDMVDGRTEATLLAKRILNALAKPVALPNGKTGHVGGSIGIALFPDDAKDAEDLMKAADEAMYVVKAKGKNNFVFAADPDVIGGKPVLDVLEGDKS
jgi:diguanylate cyclase (GGDEF)-like protein/PAS domain S-box-containing protein